MRSTAEGYGSQAIPQLESGNITDSTTIEIATSVKMKKVNGDGLSQSVVTLVEDMAEVEFVGYNQGQIKINDGDAGFIVVNSCRMIQMSTEHPVVITVTKSDLTTVELPPSKRFSYESDESIRISVDYDDATADQSAPVCSIQYVSTME